MGRTGDQTLTDEAGNVTRWARHVTGFGLVRPIMQGQACGSGGGVTPGPAWQRLRWSGQGAKSAASFTAGQSFPSLCSHLQGMFFRTVRMLESGMKPVYVCMDARVLHGTRGSPVAARRGGGSPMG